MKLFKEIHRRSLWQILGIYLAASWVAIQIVDTLSSSFGLPDWFPPLALGLLVVGLPVVLATAFVQRGGPKRQAVGPIARPFGDPEPAKPAQTATTEPESPASQPSTPEPVSHRGPLTWSNAIRGGVVAFALLGVVAAGWISMRALGIGPAATLQAQGAIEEHALVVLADFASSDPELGGAATEAFRVDLSQSDAIQLADRALIEDALGRMGREPTEALTEEIARELATREGAAAIVSGEISKAGSGWVFSARLVSAVDGETLTSQRENARSEDDVIDAIEQLSKKLRERVGESMGSIRSNPPLDRVTTSNLEALRLYSQADRIEGPRAGSRRIELFEQAIALDSGFAMAWTALAVQLRNQLTERARVVEAQTRAFELRDRLTQRERHKAAGLYYTDVTWELDKAVLEYEALLELDPADVAAVTNIGVAYSEMGRHDLSQPYTQRARELEPDQFGPGYWNTIQEKVNLGRFGEARATLDTIREKFGPGPADYTGAIVAANEGELAEAEGLLAGMHAEITAQGGSSARIMGDLAAIIATRGRVEEAGALLEEALENTSVSGPPGEIWEDLLQLAWFEHGLRSRSEAALSRIAQGLIDVPFDSMAPLDRPYAAIAEIAAQAGDVELARRMMDALDVAIAPELRRRMTPQVERANGQIAIAEGRYDDAIQHFRRSDRGFCTICADDGLGLAFDRAGQPDSAAVHYATYAETPYSDRYASYAYALGPTLGRMLERLGQLHDEQGDLENAAKYYAMFVELWADADAELQPRVEVAQARLQEIVEARG